MVIKLGVKYACPQCLKGHRVRDCKHTDRELIVVPPKGRPVTQCQHCRSERKKRSAHVNCACGSKSAPTKEKCIHLREAEAAHSEHDGIGPLDEGAVEHPDDSHGCCCHYDAECICASLKKRPSDHDGSSPSHGKQAAQSRSSKPRAKTTKSDGHLTAFSNGHRAPVHRRNNAAHESGRPYSMPGAHTLHGLHKAAGRSVDSLSLESSQTSAAPRMDLEIDQSFATGRRMSRSETGSPRLLAPSFVTDASASHMDPTALNLFGPPSMMQRMPSDPIEMFQLGATEANWDPMSGLAEAQYDPWSAMASAYSSNMPNNNPFSAWPTGSDLNLAQPALTAASSGDISEIDEVPPLSDFTDFDRQQPAQDLQAVGGFPEMQEDATVVDNFDPDLVMNTFSANRRSLPASIWSVNDMNVINALGNDAQNLDMDLFGGKSKELSAGQMPFNPIWHGLSLQTATSNNPSGFGGSPVSGLSGRPQSLYTRASSFENDDFLSRLFPEHDLYGMPMSGATISDSIAAASKNVTASMDTSEDVKGIAIPADYDDTADEITNNFEWNDVALPVGTSAFTGDFSLNQDFSIPDLSDCWRQ